MPRDWLKVQWRSVPSAGRHATFQEKKQEDHEETDPGIKYSKSYPKGKTQSNTDYRSDEGKLQWLAQVT